MALSVRQATVKDARGITRVHIAAWQVAYRGIFPDRYLEDLSLDFDDRLRRWEVIIASPDVPGTVTLVAERDGEVLGWLGYGPNRDDPPATCSAGGPDPVGEIYGIYVHPDHWRTGTGTALMEEAVARMAAAGFGEATLWVLEENPTARRFYERQGWRPDGAIDVFERGGANPTEVRYRLPLASPRPSA
jgi:GNAT superfamily N-acetyltransferase